MSKNMLNKVIELVESHKKNYAEEVRAITDMMPSGTADGIIDIISTKIAAVDDILNDLRTLKDE